MAVDTSYDELVALTDAHEELYATVRPCDFEAGTSYLIVAAVNRPSFANAVKHAKDDGWWLRAKMIVGVEECASDASILCGGINRFIKTRRLMRLRGEL